MSAQGRTIRLFLVDGSSLGIVTAEIMNWTGKMLCFPRGLLPEVLKRSELPKTGVYFLVGPDQDLIGKSMVYVGKSDDVGRRLRQHDQSPDKEFFDQVAIFVSKDENLTISHVGYLENRIIDLIRTIGGATLDNGNSGSTTNLPEAEESDMEYVLMQIRVLLPVLGFNFLQEQPKRTAVQILRDSDVSPVTFEISMFQNTIHAEAYESEGQFVVTEGSTIRHPDKRAPVVSKSYLPTIDRLRQENKLEEVNDSILKFTQDVPFGSPSAASHIVCGNHNNGRDTWLVKGTSETYASWRAAQMPAEDELSNQTGIIATEAQALHSPSNGDTSVPLPQLQPL
jgi:hypothetical protein